MRNYYFGVSTFCDDIMKLGYTIKYPASGLFDNDTGKISLNRYGLQIEKPYYSDDIYPIITLSDKYHKAVAEQLLDLGYRRFALVRKIEDEYLFLECDYSDRDYQKEKGNMIILYLEHRSYSGIVGIEKQLMNKTVSYNHELIFQTLEGECSYQDALYYRIVSKRVITERNKPSFAMNTIQIWHGYPLKAMGYMSPQSKGNSDGGNLWKHFDQIASYGKLYTALMSACYGTKASQFAEIGMPRNDLLYFSDGASSLRRLFPNADGKKMIMYMPTFREMERKVEGYIQVDADANGYLFYWEDFQLEKLEDYCKKNDLFFIFKLHPVDASKVKSWSVQSDYVGIMTDDMLGENCLYEYLNGVDLLITDYSSVYFDYLLLNRPMIFLDKDVEEYGRERGLLLEPLDYWCPGPKVHTVKALLDEISEGLFGGDRYKEARENLTPIIHKYQDGKSTQRLLDYLAKL